MAGDNQTTPSEELAIHLLGVMIGCLFDIEPDRARRLKLARRMSGTLIDFAGHTEKPVARRPAGA